MLQNVLLPSRPSCTRDDESNSHYWPYLPHHHPAHCIIHAKWETSLQRRITHTFLTIQNLTCCFEIYVVQEALKYWQRFFEPVCGGESKKNRKKYLHEFGHHLNFDYSFLRCWSMSLKMSRWNLDRIQYFLGEECLCRPRIVPFVLLGWKEMGSKELHAGCGGNPLMQCTAVVVAHKTLSYKPNICQVVSFYVTTRLTSHCLSHFSDCCHNIVKRMGFKVKSLDWRTHI